VIEHLGVAIRSFEDNAEVVVRPQLGEVQLLGLSPSRCGFEQDPRLRQPSLVEQSDRFAVQCLDEDFGQLQPLGQGERPLERCGGGLVVAREDPHAAELGERCRQLSAGLALLELRDRLFEPGCRFLHPPLPDIDVGERGAGARGSPSVARLRV